MRQLKNTEVIKYDDPEEQFTGGELPPEDDEDNNP